MTETIELKRVGDGNLRAQVYQQIRLTIQHGELAPGQKLVDVDIAAQLGHFQNACPRRLDAVGA
ncbi:hypothetical protein NKI19_08890 [Mesorhizobium sp. M0751]|uniref:hypothetical protein n=1 Tax=unclassified Mesorhizobium TaxID=325217 RepID=UPI003334E1AE